VIAPLSPLPSYAEEMARVLAQMASPVSEVKTKRKYDPRVELYLDILADIDNSISLSDFD
jgi:hypothetical protein